jgi:hypothetical protein
MFPLDYDPTFTKAMVRSRQEQVRASFTRTITRWLAPEPRPVAPDVSATAIPRLTEVAIPEPRLPEREQKYVA